MKNKAILLIFVLILGGCQKKKYVGIYISQCRLHAKSDVVLICRPDSSFQYKFAYNPDSIIGNWQIKNDTLILSSDYFITRDENMWRKKNSDFEDVDKYILKKKSLYLINTNGIDRKCPLTKSQ